MTRRAVWLIGRGIGYSASPALHNAAFTACGMDLHYGLLDIPPEAVAQALDRVRNEAVGANVTTPHKVAAAAHVDELSADASEVGAVNTLVLDPQGRLIGHNTDLPALVDEIAAIRSGARHAVVLGGGGAGRAVTLALGRAGAECVSVVSRRAEWGHSADDLPRLLADADLLINATPVGTEGDDSPISAQLLRPGLAVLDLVYRPSPTRLVSDARALGAPARAGAGLLLGQGRRSFELWLHHPAPVDVMREALRRELGGNADV
ncbi:shikimate dehydrogenase [soil metagenome]